MAGFVDHLQAEILALERSLETDPRFVKLRELRRVHDLYAGQRGASSADSPLRAREPQKRPAPREMSQATRSVVNAATEYLTDRSDIVPLRVLYHHIAEERGIHIGGADKINNLSAILYRYGFEAQGRSGWRLKQEYRLGEANLSEPERDDDLSCMPRANGAANEMHGAATL
jgi:hypothetical protein